MLAWIATRPAAPSGIALSARTRAARRSASPLTTNATAARTDTTCTFACGAVSAASRQGYIHGITFDVAGHILAEEVSQEQEKTITIPWGMFPGDVEAEMGGMGARRARLRFTRWQALARSAICALLNVCVPDSLVCMAQAAERSA